MKHIKMTDPQQYFTENLSRYEGLLMQTKTTLRKISLYRIIIFLVTAIGIYISVAYNYPVLAALFCFGIVLFILLVIRHIKMELRKKKYEILVNINQEELWLIDGDFSHADKGEDFSDADHYYSDDLDIFGSKSIFQLFNRTSTFRGRQHLAKRLKEPLYNIKILKKRQEAINELKEKPDMRQNFQGEGRNFDEKTDDIDNIIKWSGSNEISFNNTFYRSLLIINPLIAATIITLIYLNILTFASFLLFMILPFSLIGTRLGKFNRLHNQISNKTDVLKGYSKLFEIIGQESFNSVLLKNSQNELCGTDSASNAIKELADITKSMDYRLNMIVGILLNIFFVVGYKTGNSSRKMETKVFSKT